MGLGFRRTSIRTLSVLIATFLLHAPLFAQRPRVLAPHRPIPQRVNKKIDWSKEETHRSMIGGFWMTDANFKSSIYLRNVVESDPITVTPILWLANGTKYKLADVTIEPAGTAIIDLNAGLQSVGISSSATLSGYVELQYAWPWDPLCATIRNIDVAHSLIFTYGLRSATPLNPQAAAAQSGPQIVQGMWWRETMGVTGFVALANVSSEPVQATVQVSDALARSLVEHTVTVSPHGMKLVNLPELPQAPDSVGGLRIAYTGSPDALIVNGGVEDESVGYSAILPFASRPLQASDLPPYAKPADFNGIVELGLMAGAADPMMNFPANTIFKPYSVLRNLSDAPLAVTPTIWWMQGGVAHSASLQQIQLQPQESRNLDVMAMLSLAGLGNFSGSFNLAFEGDLKPGALVLSAGSVDQSKTYVFEVTPRAMGVSASKSLQYWSTGNGDDTMVTLWNPADEAQDLVFTLFFSGGHYLVPIHLDARATRSINISEITQSSLPDAEGNIIPAFIHEGSAKITGSQADNEIILVAADSGTYNVRKATCSQNCMACNGYSNWAVQLSAFGVGVGQQSTLSLTAAYDGGSRYSFAGTWNSNNTSIATVGSSTGTVTGVSGGTVQIGGSVANISSAPVYAANVCSPYNPCPVGFGGGAGSTGTVVSITITGVGPSPVLGSSGGITISGTNFNSLAGTVNIMTDGGLVVGGAVVQNATTIQATYNATNCSILVGPQNLWIQGSMTEGGQITTNRWPISVVLPPAPAPAIFFSGNNITGTTQSVVVGQQIGLSAPPPSLPNCMSLSSQQWSTPPGTAVGGYAASSSSGSVTPLPPTNNNSSYQFYWVTPGNPLNMTYQYSMFGGGVSVNSPVASATFNVEGPSGVNVTSTTGTWIITQNGKLQFGQLVGSVGILFTASATPPGGFSNNFWWVQYINNENTVFNSTIHGTVTCSPSSGFDGDSYPLTTGTLSGDSPSINVNPDGDETRAQDNFDATMYLFWSSGLNPSIPVPLGYVHWTATGVANLVSGTWTVDSQDSSSTPDSFQASSSYPIWSFNVADHQGECTFQF